LARTPGLHFSAQAETLPARYANYGAGLESWSAAFWSTPRVTMRGIQQPPTRPPALFTILVRAKAAAKNPTKSKNSVIQEPPLTGRCPPTPLLRAGLCREYYSRCPQRVFRR